jgi:2-hydroxychromene-2-carboxylate isomerase
MADLEFFFDPVCPWAWITSRWVVEVQQQRDYDIQWRFISLQRINAERPDDEYTTPHRAAHFAGLLAHRVCDEVRLGHGNDGVAALYTALGEAFHRQQRRPEINDDPVAFMTEMLANAGLPTELAAHVNDESHDAYIAAETDLAFSRTGPDVGTPIITFHPGASNEASFFGPVISVIPRGEEATRLWDAIEIVAGNPDLAELKRSIRRAPQFD